MYQAIRRRDTSWVGQLFVGVTTTGVFCRPGCPARVPLRAHCEFFRSSRDALRCGFRPCKRCRPLDPPAAAPRWAQQLVKRLIDHPGRVLTVADVREVGVHPSTVSRFFKQQLGVTLQALSRAQRVGLALRALREGGNMSHALSASGLDSESGLRKAIDELFGATPTAAVRRALTPLVARWLATPLGSLLAIASDEGLCLLEFVDRRMLATNIQRVRKRWGVPIIAGDHPHIVRIERELQKYFLGALSSFETPLCLRGTPFQERVWRALLEIPHGQTRSYLQIARRIGQATAVRAVATANGDNRLAIVIPCHRVIGSDGKLVGYGGGLWRKRRLLEIECGAIAVAARAATAQARPN